MKGAGRKLLLAVVPALLALMPASAAVADEAGQAPRIIIGMNENKGTWTSNASPVKEGGQTLTYYSLSYLEGNCGISVLGSFADTTYNYNDIATKNDFHLGALTDTTVSAYYMAPKVLDLNLRLGLDLNLPTGHSGFGNDQLKSLMIDGVSKDLILVPQFGKGYNVAPNVAVTRALGDTTVGLGMRYELTGDYNPTTEVPDKRYDPGNTLTLFGSVQYNLTKRDQFFVDLSTVFSERDKQGGVEVLKQGTAYNLGVRYIKTYEATRVIYGFTYGWQDKNQTYDGGGVTTEDRNTNNNRWEFQVSGLQALTGNLMANGIVGLKTVNSNGYDRLEALYDAGYQKFYFGGGPLFIVSDILSFTAELRWFEVWNGSDSLEPTAAAYRGVNIDIGFVYQFGLSPKKTDTAS